MDIPPDVASNSVHGPGATATREHRYAAAFAAAMLSGIEWMHYPRCPCMHAWHARALASMPYVRAEASWVSAPRCRYRAPPLTLMCSTGAAGLS